MLNVFSWKNENTSLYNLLALLKKEEERLKRTPDLSLLERKEFQEVFIPDEIQQGLHRHDIIAGHCEFRGTGFTAHTFAVCKKNGPLPEAIPLINTGETDSLRRWKVPLGRIQGQLFAVRPYRIPDLDEYKDNLTAFMRVRIPIIMPHKKVTWFKDLYKTMQEKHVDIDTFFRQNPRKPGELTSKTIYSRVKAWMYIGVPSFWNQIIDNGFEYSFLKTITPRKNPLGEYFKFSRLDYEK